MESLINQFSNILIGKNDSSNNNNNNNNNYQRNYKSMNVFPNENDLNQDNLSIPIPINKIKGPFGSVEDYLHTHFSLLREDFIKPIKEDLIKYRTNPHQKLLNIRIHQVKFTRKGVKQDNLCYCIDILKGLTDNAKWIFQKDNNNKRFMLGSLLIFSTDEFKTFFCGRVADDRNIIYRKLLVNIANAANNNLIFNNKKYQMIECNIFFEPYYHVLKALQNINTATFPLAKYLINVENTVNLPKYFNGTHYKISSASTELNRSQVLALNGALNQELIIIQGPPGTGKTFLGLKIAKTLLEISNYWYDNGSPMLIISYTNHALDQFLEGLIGAADHRILRYGSQSKNPKLKNYVLREARSRFYNLNPINRMMRRNVGTTFREICQLEKEITYIGNQLDNIRTSRPSCIFFFDIMATKVTDMNGWFLPKTHQWGFTKDYSEMISWLLQDDGTMFEEEIDQDIDEISILREIYETYIKTPKLNSKYCMISISMLGNIVYQLYEKILDMSTAVIKATKELVGKESLAYCLKLRKKFKNLNETYFYLIKKIDYLKRCFRKLKKTPIIKPTFNYQCSKESPFTIPVNKRWEIYRYWVVLYENNLETRLNSLISEHKNEFKHFDTIQERNNLALMKYQKVIGMTTTMAARMRKEIEAIKCKIVIVEEAAEVLEAHIIPVLTEHCQHLILIGDHKQLKPSTADYFIETEHKLGVSMFERMVNNNLQCYTLNVQHRMRPELSCLITPSIYPELKNHESVLKFDKINGVQECLYFLSHTYPEEPAGNTSKKNTYEAKFLVRFALYLLQNGYKSEDITILAAYLGQVGALKYEQKLNASLHSEIEKILITSVDNFQGEENKIILLSLVRNNDSSNIGFLAIDNRVCVALSRAKQGMYILGNMQQLTKYTQLWRTISTSLKSQNALGEELPLKCQEHGIITYIRNSEDFDNLAPSGGCKNICGKLLKCGHKCSKICHNGGHEKYECRELCEKILCKNKHKCLKLCYLKCSALCSKKLKEKLECGHHVQCFMVELEDYRCLEPVMVVLKCGHKTQIECYNVENDFEDGCRTCVNNKETQKLAAIGKMCNSFYHRVNLNKQTESEESSSEDDDDDDDDDEEELQLLSELSIEIPNSPAAFGIVKQ